MNWPQSTDYFEALQNPQSCFGDPDLRQGQVTVTPLGLPRVCSGNFADVYQVVGPDGGAWAVKCFTRPAAGLQRRYEAVSRLLTEKSFPFTVSFQYLDRGIRIGGEWFPIVKMRWVDGLTLSEFVRTHLDRPRLLEELLQMWRKLARQLHQVGMAHADLQHGNVLLVPTASGKSLRLTLIDYDGFLVPELLHVPSGEFGHPNYQHPSRSRDGTYRPEVDRFSHLVVCCALQALVLGGRELWDRHDNGDNLLFRQADLEAPGQSRLFQELWRWDDAVLHAWTGRLVLACQGALEEVPPLEDLFSLAGAPLPLVLTETQRVEQLFPPDVFALQQESAPMAAPSLPWWVNFQESEGYCPAPAKGWGQLESEERRARSEERRARSEERRARSEERETRIDEPTEEGDLPSSILSAWTRFWDSVTGPKTWRAHGDCVLSVAFSPDNRLIASTSRDRTIKVWYLGTGQELVTLRGHAARVNSAVFNAGSTHILSGSDDKTIKVWDLASGREVFTLRGHNDAVYSVAFHPDGRRIASGSFDKTVRLWDLASRSEMHILHGHTGYVYGIAYSPDGRQLVSGGFDQVVKVWDAEAGREIWTPRTTGGPITSVAFSPSGHFVAAGSRSGIVEVWDAHPGRKVYTFPAEAESVLCVAFSPDGVWLLSGDDNKLLRLWNLRRGRAGATLRGHTDAVSSVAFSPDGKHIISGSWDGTLKLWDAVPRRSG
jgi:hypothetical protein